MLKKITCFLFSLLLCLNICSCSSKKEENKSINIIDIEVLQKAMLDAAPSLSESIQINSKAEDAETNFMGFSNLDYEKVDGFFLCYSKDAVADEIAVIRVKNNADVQSALDSLETHAEQKMSLFSDYSAKGTEKYSAFCEGNYAVLIICEEADTVKQAFINEIKK